MPELQWETVPAGTQPSRCRAKECGQEIFWIERESRSKKGGIVRVPVDCDVAGGSAPDSFSPGRGVNHYQTCCAADQF